MSLSSFAYTLSLFWLIVHALHRLLIHKKYESILPTDRTGSPGRTYATTWNIALHFLQARIETTRWNEVHDRLLNRWKRKRGMALSTRRVGAEGIRMEVWLERLYNLGFVVGVVGMGVALLLLLWTTWTLLKPLMMHKVTSGGLGRLMKRDDMTGTLNEDTTTGSPITPIVPGVTVPLNHLPFILVSLFFSQIIHELGHAISGALYGVPILSSGVSLIVCIPTAFVAFSTEKLDSLRPVTKARITAAGPFHNMLFWGFWLLVGWVLKSADGMVGGGLLKLVGYRDVSAFGRVVITVEELSPLAGHVIPGMIVTKLNDHSMASSRGVPDPWGSFLKTRKSDRIELGWCTASTEMSSSPKECCLPDEPAPASLSCFVASDVPVRLGCLNPVPILNSTDKEMRCASGGGCKEGFVCVRPAEKENLLRLAVMDGKHEHEEVVLWTGPREEIYDEVTIGKWLPRFFFLPLNLPMWLNTFWEYMLMVNLSLLLFNLVPIGSLDGLHLLRSVLAISKERDGREIYGLEALERGEAEDVARFGRRPRFEYLEKVISGGAGILIALDLVLAVLNVIRT